ncbi:hypothetical protein ACFFQF_13725 [Haladaptatus pallidirubidus]|uniref:DUF7504 family protein n=1 Tax=Haladaptatus pallidirubidus TaxID=1008152 RepID=UPI0035EA4B99
MRFSTVHVPPSATNALLVSYKQSPEELLERWRERFGDEPSSFGIIAVGNHGSPRQTENDRNVVSLVRPDCLGRLQTAMYLYLDQWSTTDRQQVLCFDSITAMLRHVNRTIAFRFVHSLTNSLRRFDVDAHFHMHPQAHDEETIAMFRPLFDTVIDGPPKTAPTISPEALSVLLDSPGDVSSADTSPKSRIPRMYRPSPTESRCGNPKLRRAEILESEFTSRFDTSTCRNWSKWAWSNSMERRSRRRLKPKNWLGTAESQAKREPRPRRNRPSRTAMNCRRETLPETNRTKPTGRCMALHGIRSW